MVELIIFLGNLKFVNKSLVILEFLLVFLVDEKRLV